MSSKFHRPLADYIEYWEKISPRSVRLIEKLAVSGFRFSDPFHTLHGLDAFEAMLHKMFSSTDKVSFKVKDMAWGMDGRTAYLKWIFTAVPKGRKKQITIIGMSEILFADDGKVMSHTDHWDSGSQLLSRLPLIGGIFRFVAGKIAGS